MKKSDFLSDRKQLLALRAELQRMELSSDWSDVRQALSWTQVLTGVLGKWPNYSQVIAVSGTLRHWLRDYPLLATVASLVFARLRKPLLKWSLRVTVMGMLTKALYGWLRARRA